MQWGACPTKLLPFPLRLELSAIVGSHGGFTVGVIDLETWPCQLGAMHGRVSPRALARSDGRQLVLMCPRGNVSRLWPIQI
jgi:hypothetical protein